MHARTHHKPCIGNTLHGNWDMARHLAPSRKRQIMLTLLLLFCCTGLLSVHYFHDRSGMQTINAMLSLERQAFMSFSSLQVR